MKKCALREILILLKRASYKKIPATIIERLESIHLGELKKRQEKKPEEKIGKKR